MIDITDKNTVKREAMATGTIKLNKETIKLIREKQVKKGDVIETAKIAGTIAVKNTSGMIPYCHPVPVMSIDFNFEVEDNESLKIFKRIQILYEGSYADIEKKLQEAGFKTHIEKRALQNLAGDTGFICAEYSNPS